jgi:hypothetical protein
LIFYFKNNKPDYMFTIEQTLSYPSFFQKRLDNFSYFFKRLVPLLLVYFVSFSNSTSAQTTSIYSDACGCGTDKECKFKGDSKVCPGSYNTYCIHKKVKKGYTYLWSVKGDGCYVPAPSECKKSCITIRAKNSCWASYTVKLKIRDKYGKTVSTCKKVVWVGDKEKPVITCPPPVTVECYNDIPGHTSGNFYAQGGTASDNCGKVSVAWISDKVVKNEKCKKVIKRTYRATDKCGLTADCYQLITVEDTKAPVFYNCPGKPIVIKTCDKDAICEEIGKIYATDNCDDDVKYWHKIKELYSNCDRCDYAEDDENGWQEGKLSKDRRFKCFKVYLVVIKAKDKCGNVSKCKFKIIVKKGDDCNDKDAIVSSRPVNTGKPDLSNQESSTLSVRTAPNPYRDKIRFVIQSKVSGPANLELYNLLGQKVQSVYKGQINAGRSQIIDVDVPPSMRTNLIYRLNVGGQFKTGKVIKE